MKKKEIIIAILLVIFVVFNACGSYLEYYMTCKVGYLDDLLKIGFIMFWVFILFNIVFLVISVKSGNCSICIVTVYWVIALLRQIALFLPKILRRYIMYISLALNDGWLPFVVRRDPPSFSGISYNVWGYTGTLSIAYMARIFISIVFLIISFRYTIKYFRALNKNSVD